MDKLKIYKVLEINETKDKEKIKAAYRAKLLHTNPEEDPEGFKELREAYDAANRLCDEQQEEQEIITDDLPVDRWIKKVETCYFSLKTRIDTSKWQELLSDDVCLDLDTSLEARDRLLSFMMSHFRLSREILQLINDVFTIAEEKEELKERFPINFLNFIEYQISNDVFFNMNLFKGNDDAQFDSFINEYMKIKEKVEAKNFEGIDKLFEDIERFEIYHPYLEAEKIKYAMISGKAVDNDIITALTRDYSDNIYINYTLISVKWEAGQYEDAYEELTALINKCTDHYPARKLIAKYYFIKENYETAKEEFESLLNINASDSEVYDLLKKANEHLIIDYEKQRQEGTLSFDNILELGWCYYENERSEECKNLLLNIAPANEHHLDYHNLLGRTYVSLHEYEAALSHLAIWEKEIQKLNDDGSDKYKKRKRRFVLAKYLQALCWFELSAKKKEDSFKEKALEILEFNIDEWDDTGVCLSCHTLKAQTLLELGRSRECIDVCRHIIDMEESYFPAYVFMQQAYEKLRDVQMVIDTFYQAVELYADYVKPYTLAAKVFLCIQQYDDSKRIIQMAKDRNLKDPELELIEIKVLRYSAETFDQTREMIPLCDKLIELITANDITEPSIHDVYNEKIYAYMDIENHGQALNIVIECLKSWPDNEEYYRIKAKILYNMQQYKEALTIFEAHLKEHEYDSSYVMDMAACCEKLNQTDKAINAYNQVLKINPEHNNANSRLSNIYYEKIKEKWNREEYSLAVDYAAKQIEINESGYYYIECALIYIEGYEFDKALECLNKVIEIEPDNLYAYNNIGWVYQLTKRNEDALKMYNKAIEMNATERTSLPYRNLSDMYLAMQEYDKAYEILLKCQELFPSYSWHKIIGSCLERSGRYNDASTEYNKAIAKDKTKEAFYIERIALCYESAGDLKSAKKYHKTYAFLTGSSLKADNNLGDFYLFCHDNIKKAYKYYHLAFKKSLKDKNSSDYLDCLLNMAEISYIKGDKRQAGFCYDEAMAYFTKKYSSLEKYIDCPSYRIIHIFIIFKFHFFAGLYDKAEQYMGRLFCNTRCTCCEFNICKEALIAKGFCHMAEHEYEQALECLIQVLKEDKNDTQVRYYISKLNYKIKQNN